MTVATIPGAQHDQNSLGLSQQDSDDLNSLFTNSFQNLLGQSGTGSGSGASTAAQQDTISAIGNNQATRLSVDGVVMNFIGGAGSAPFSVGNNATIYGAANTTYHYGGANLGGITTFDTTTAGHLQAENILFDASSSRQSLHVAAGLGDTIKGGSAADTISVHNTVTGGQNGATLSGGSGAANLFQFLNNKGGQYTISDFRQASGNKIGLKATDAQIQTMLDNKTVKGGNVTIELPDDQGQITFQNLNQLNPKDFQKF